MSSRQNVNIGDRFTRVGQARKIYVVSRIDERAHHLPHARLTAQTLDREEITVSVKTLLDRRFFMPAPVAQ
ncbi:DUF4224 domain-containing protein [Azospirillaceae bacterium]